MANSNILKDYDSSYSTLNTGLLSTGVIALTAMDISTYNSPITATGEFLTVQVNGIYMFVKLFS